MGMDPNVKKWLDSGEYLPPFLRDFHDQKTFFKWIGLRVSKREREDRHISEDRRFNWVLCHIWVVDYVLWFLAAMGYTVQKSRKNLPFPEIDAQIKAIEEEWREHCAKTAPDFYPSKSE